MIPEHQSIMCDISLLLTDILKPYTKDVKFTVKYLNDIEFDALEVFVLNGQLQDRDHNRFVKEIKKSNIINHIYTLEDGKLYTVFLKPLKEIRSFKINKLQNKITNETDNKV
jgi:hypothetical protein